MLRQSRLDAPGTLHRVMGRGIERTKIFRTREDREDFLARLGEPCRVGALRVYAWLMDNHFHLLLTSGNQSLSQSMRKLLTGYVINFNMISEMNTIHQLKKVTSVRKSDLFENWLPKRNEDGHWKLTVFLSGKGVGLGKGQRNA